MKKTPIDKKSGPKYHLTCSFKEGNRRLTEAWEGLSGQECLANAAEWLDVFKKDGVVQAPHYREIRKNLSAYCDEENIRREYEHQKAAYAAWKKVSDFVGSGETGTFCAPHGKLEYVLVEARA